MSNITFDATINPDRPDLPFAQASQFNPMWSGTINPDRPDLPFAQTMTGGVNRHMTKSTSGNYTIYWKNGGQSTMDLSNSVANQYRTLGHTVVLNNAKSSEKDIVKLDDGISKSEIEQIFIDYYGDDISLLHTHASELGAAMRRAKVQRDEIEARINKIKAIDYGADISLIHKNLTGLGKAMVSAKEHRDMNAEKIEQNRLSFADIHTKLQSLGDSQIGAKEHRDSIESKFNIHAVHEIIPTIPNPFDPERYLPYILIGGVALLALSGRKKR